MALGGRAAEDVVFGKGEIILLWWGLSTSRLWLKWLKDLEHNLGPIALEGGNQEVVGRDLMTRSEVSDSISKQIDESVRVMVSEKL